MAKVHEILTQLRESADAQALPAEFKPKNISPVIQGHYDKRHPTAGYFVGGEGRGSGFSIGDPVVITGNVEYQGKTGDVRELGRDGAFVVVDLYNHGPHSFHSSDVSYNEYADSDEEDDRAQGVSEGRVKELEMDLEDPTMSNSEFVTKYGKARAAMARGLGLVQDRKTGRFYDPDQEFDRLKNSPEFGAQMRRMAQRDGVAEGYYDSDNYYNARSAGEYGRPDLSASGQPEPGYGASASDNRTPKQDQQAKYKIPADPFGRIKGKVPQGQPGRVITRATPGEQAADREQKAYEIISRINASSSSDTEKRAARRAVLKKYGMAESATTEDLVSAVKTKLGDYLQDVATAIKKDPDLLSKQSQDNSDIKTVKTITTDDGHEIKIHGNEDDGFRISIKDQKLKTQFDNLDEAAMAAEMYCSRRRQTLEQQTNRDYLDEQ